MERMNLQRFGGGGSSSGSHGTSGSPKVSGNAYEAARNYWRELEYNNAGSGMNNLLNELEKQAGGKLGDETVKVVYGNRERYGNKMTALNGPMREIFSTGGTDDYSVTRENGFFVFNANRKGWMSFQERMKERLKSKGKWW